MEEWLSRKMKKTSHSDKSMPSSTIQEVTRTKADEEESTDFKLTVLASLYPTIKQQILLEVLLDCDGSVSKAVASLSRLEKEGPPPKRVIGSQSSLSGYLRVGASAKGPKILSKKGKTLHLYSPEDVAAHTPCSIIHNFLPVDQANALLIELLGEAQSFQRMTFKLFDNVVQSPHTACFYVDGLEEQEKQKTEYIYNGDRLSDVRQITPQMYKVSPMVEVSVNSEIETRTTTKYPHGKKLRYQSPGRWKPNAAFVNCYNGGAESVGYHSDQLTYLGPRAVIGSISLGVAREFRVRKIIPQGNESKGSPRDKVKGDEEGQIAIHLPHNSLLVMHAGMQEEWKHSIVPAQAIDPHPIAGNRRINITYRDYKAYLHPKFTPKCNCGMPTVLRVVQRKKENWGKYFWICHAGNVPGKEGCTFFEWAKFTDEGEPVWGAREQFGK